MNGLDLLIQIKVALVFFHLALDAATDFFIDIEDVDFALDLLKQVFKPVLDAGQVQHCLLAVELERQMGGNGVRKSSCVVNAGDGGQNFGWDFLVQFDVLVKLLHHSTAQSLNFTGFAAGLDLGVSQHLHGGHIC